MTFPLIMKIFNFSGKGRGGVRGGAKNKEE
jgi:hypothetical protein